MCFPIVSIAPCCEERGRGHRTRTGRKSIRVHRHPAFMTKELQEEVVIIEAAGWFDDVRASFSEHGNLGGEALHTGCPEAVSWLRPTNRCLSQR